jgi:amino acid permease
LSKRTGRPKLIVFAVVTYVLAIVAFVFLWYFLMANVSAITRAITEVASVGRPSGAFQENIRIVDELSVIVLRYGWIPVFIGGIGDLTPYYLGYGIVVAAALAWWVKKRW